MRINYLCESTLISSLTSILTAQVVPQRGSTEARVAGVVAEGLVARTLVGDDEVTRFDRHRADEDGQQGYGDYQQDDEGSAGVDVGPHQTHKQAQQKDYRGVQYCVPVTLRKHSYCLGHW